MAQQRITANGEIIEQQPDGKGGTVWVVVGYQDSGPEVTPLPPTPGQAADVRHTETGTRQTETQIQSMRWRILTPEEAGKYGLSKSKIWKMNEAGDVEPAGDAVADPSSVAQGSADQYTYAQKLAALQSAEDQINRVQELYNKNYRDEPRGLASSIAEFAPGPDAEQFNVAGSNLSDIMLSAFRIAGVGSQSDKDAERKAEALQSSNWTLDSGVEEKLRSARLQIENMRAALQMPPPKWTGLPEEEKRPQSMPNAGVGGASGGQPPPPTVWDMLYADPGPHAKGAGFSEKNKSVPLPPEAQRAYTDYVAGAIANGGYLDPEAFGQFQAELMNRYAPQAAPGGTGKADPAVYAEWARGYNETLRADRARTGGQGGSVPPPPGYTVPMTLGENARNKLALATAPITGAANAATFGGVEALAPEAMAALENHENPYVGYGTLAGEVAGSIYGANKLGTLGGMVARRALPARLAVKVLRGGGKAGTLARNVATDAAYGGAYGGVTEGNPLPGAGLAAAASGAGNTLGRAIGTAVGGVKQLPQAERLADRIRMTVGQRMGGVAQRIENKATSLPLAGDMIEARYKGSIDDLNRATFDEGMAPIGGKVANIAERGVEQADALVGEAYEKDLGGRAFDLGDPDFVKSMDEALEKAVAVPKTGEDAAYLIQNAIIPHVGPGGTIPGRAFQMARRDLVTARRKLADGQDATGHASAEAVDDAINALDDLVRRQAPDAYEGYMAANAAYRNLKVIEDAVAAGINTGGKFSASQLGFAARKSGAKFGGVKAKTDRPFYQLQRDAQDVLPSKIPESGTGPRVMQAAIGTGLLGLGSGAGALASEDHVAGAGSGAGMTLAALLALAAGGTRGGQRALNKALFDRSAGARKLGSIIGKHSGLAGTAAIPLILNSGN